MTLTMSDIRSSDRVTLTRTEVAEALGVDVRTLTTGIAEGSIPSIRIGRRVVIPRERLLRVLDGVPQESSL